MPSKLPPRPQSQPKVVLLGDEGVGKTSLLRRHLRREYADKVDATMGMDNHVCSLPGIESLKNSMMDLNTGPLSSVVIMDTAGAKRWQTIATAYVNAATVVVFMFDIRDRRAFRDFFDPNTGRWEPQIKQFNKNKHKASAPGWWMQMYLVATKCDCEAEREVKTEEGDEMARKIGARYFETSAKKDEGVTELFEDISNWLMNPTPPEEVRGAQGTAASSTSPCCTVQ